LGAHAEAAMDPWQLAGATDEPREGPEWGCHTGIRAAPPKLPQSARGCTGVDSYMLERMTSKCLTGVTRPLSECYQEPATVVVVKDDQMATATAKSAETEGKAVGSKKKTKKKTPPHQNPTVQDGAEG
jgi:hypothetical protein